MKRSAFLSLLLIPVLAGCGGSNNSGDNNNVPRDQTSDRAILAGGGPLFYSDSIDPKPFKLYVFLSQFKATSRGEVVVRLRSQNDPTLTLTGVPVDEQTPISRYNQTTLVTFAILPTGTYYIEAVDSDGSVASTTSSGSRVSVVITQ